MKMRKEDKIFLTGHTGLLGKAIQKELLNQNYENVITVSSKDLDLLNQKKVYEFFKEFKPKYVIHAAAKAGGILANKEFPADFLFNNLVMQSNVFRASLEAKVKKLIFISSTCVYPKNVSQPMKESDILSSGFTKEVEPYSLAKVTGMKMLKAFYDQYGFLSNSVLLPNLFGPGDHYGDLSNHVIPALVERFVKAEMNNSSSVEVWGSGDAIREFLHIDDAARGIIFILKKYKIVDPINLSSKSHISIKELALKIKFISGFNGDIIFNVSKPEGAPIKISDDKSISSLGWKPKIDFEEGLLRTIEDYKNSHF
tara:strand:+ start:4848 stop:5783 length:936 start_codon:yes stop_codon:yes gene_type:complete